jgi:hypothetical protein
MCVESIKLLHKVQFGLEYSSVLWLTSSIHPAIIIILHSMHFWAHLSPHLKLAKTETIQYQLSLVCFLTDLTSQQAVSLCLKFHPISINNVEDKHFIRSMAYAILIQNINLNFLQKLLQSLGLELK